MSELDWMDQAACAGLDDHTFFPEHGQAGDYQTARAVCATCPVQPDCLAYAVEHCIDHGFWGGTTAKDRNRARRAAGKFKPLADSYEHGTNWGWKHCNPRCDTCKRWRRDYQAAYRARRKAGLTDIRQRRAS